MGGAAAASSARVRIKGRKLSVVRFLIISIAYTTPWIIMLSQLAYYSKIYGPQVLLQLNIAYYLPSIPILLLLGHIEKILDEQFGSTASMAIRLTVGLTGCAAISALYPFIPGRLSYLLWLVVALGSISAVAFSTSYQLVAWFRSADTIALGIGCVASGPLALIIQLALHIGTTPKRWQWIGLFEAAAGLVLVGLLAAWSLLWQYWNILCGKEEYVDSSTPLLDSAEQAAADHVDDEAGEAALMLSRMLTMQDPFQGFPFTTMPGMELPHLRPLLRRALSDDLSDIRRLTHRSAAAAAAARGLHRAETAGSSSSPRARAAAAAAAAATAAAAAALPRKTGKAAAAAAASKLSAGAAGSAAAAAASSLTSGRQRTQQWLQQQQQGGSSAAWLGDIEQQQQCGSSDLLPGSGFVAGSIGTSSPYSSSRPASPCPIPMPRSDANNTAAAVGSAAAAAAGVGSYLADLPDFGAPGDAFVAQRQLPMATSAPTTTTASLLGDDDDDADDVPLANALVAAATAAAAAAAAAAAPGEGEDWSIAAEQQQQQQQTEMPQPGKRGQAAAAAGGSSQLGMEYSQQGWPAPGSAAAAAAAAAAAGHSPASSPRASKALADSQSAAAAAARGGGGAATFIDIRPPSPFKQHSSSYTDLQQPLLLGHAAAAKPPLHAGTQQQQQQQDKQQQRYRHARTGSNVSAVSAFSAAGSEAAAAAGGSSCCGVAASEAGTGRGDFGDAESLGAVYWEVFKYCWSTVLAALVSSTLLNCIFPFFTYVESSGMLGEFLPQVLFYTRMLSDILGRLLPRKKALAITSPAALLALSGALLLCSVAFFVYLQVPPRMQYDPYVMVLVLALWLGGGYINTMSYILAPSLVPPRICTKASATMALTYQIAHILGLCIAIGIALGLYGDIAGGL